MSPPFPQLGGNRETLEVLNPFLQVIRSDAAIAIPVETLKGALGHFVATLEGDQLDSFINDILASKSLWKALGPSGMEEAVRPAPTVKVRNLKPDLKDGWFTRDKLGKACRAWLEQVFIASKKPKSDHVVYFYIGLLKGVDDASDIKWGQPREDIEEEVVVALSDRLQPKSVKAKEREMELDELEPGLESYCKAANHIDAARLRVLDLSAVIPELHNALFESLGYPPQAFDRKRMDLKRTKQLSKGLSQTIVALSQGGDTSQAFAWEAATVYVNRMFDLAQSFHAEWTKVSKPASGSVEREREKTALSSFTNVTWPVVEILLEPHSYGTRKERVTLASHIVLTMGKFASLAQDLETPSDWYEEVLYGCVDIIAASGGVSAVRQLLIDLNESKVSDSLAGFILVVSEQLIRLIDPESMRDIVFPLSQKYIVRPQHRASFEAANAFLLTLLDTASNSLQTDLSQGPFVDALALILAAALLRQARDEGVKAEQLGAAYPLVVRAAARRSVELVEQCIALLNAATFPTKEYEFSVKKIRIAIAPHIPRPLMPAYLDAIAQLMIEYPRDSEARLELAGLAFKVVMGDMPDESKQMAVEWWLRWRRRFEGGTDAPQARL